MDSQQKQQGQAQDAPPGQAPSANAAAEAAPSVALSRAQQPGAAAGEPTDQGLYRQPAAYQSPPASAAGEVSPPAAWQPGLAQQHRGAGHLGHYGEQDWGASEFRHSYGAPGFGRAPGGGYLGGPYGRPAGARKGPKDFVRSDERIREAVCERLFDHEWIDVSDVSVEVSAGCVRLEGTVVERRMKHAIEDIADSCLGVRDVDNRIRVRRPGEVEPEPPAGAPEQDR